MLLSACATADGNLKAQLDSTRAELRTLERENAELARRVDAMATQIDLLQARASRPAASQAAARPAPEPAPAIPPDLKVVKLEPPRATQAASPKSGTKAPARPAHPPPVPIDTPIQDPPSGGAAP